mmetsp:Transcript_16234/g.32380  ORF Transcript_16234/g.32380 Transcript_16234/m.32380 type:complete len:292 (+) Transcript_16234:151-1026(+)
MDKGPTNSTRKRRVFSAPGVDCCHLAAFGWPRRCHSGRALVINHLELACVTVHPLLAVVVEIRFKLLSTQPTAQSRAAHLITFHRYRLSCGRRRRCTGTPAAACPAADTNSKPRKCAAAWTPLSCFAAATLRIVAKALGDPGALRLRPRTRQTPRSGCARAAVDDLQVHGDLARGLEPERVLGAHARQGRELPSSGGGTRARPKPVAEGRFAVKPRARQGRGSRFVQSCQKNRGRGSASSGLARQFTRFHPPCTWPLFNVRRRSMRGQHRQHRPHFRRKRFFCLFFLGHPS